MIEDLFGSKTRIKLLRLFYANVNRSFYVREITRKIDEQINSVRRELSNLLKIGIITSDTNNNKLYYEVNQKFEYFQPLLVIFGKSPSGGSLADKKPANTNTNDNSDESAFSSLGKVELALFTGQFTRDELAGVDLLVVGNINQNKLEKLVNELEAREVKEIRYAWFKPDEFTYRRQVNDRFINNVMAAKKQVIIDLNGIINED